MSFDRFDVVVVGASIAGCTAAVLYAREGLQVALLEAHRDPAHHKRSCTHFVQASATPTIRRLGLADDLEAAGALPNRMDVWTRWGWIRAEAGEDGHGYNVPRRVLDPLLRSRAAAEPGVTLLLGHTATRLVYAGHRVVGVEARTPDGSLVVTAGLVVGADGRHSRVARLAGVRSRERAHGRFVYHATFDGVDLGADGASRTWFLEPDVVYAFPNPGGTVLSVMPAKDALPAFRADVEGSFRAALARLPDGTDLSAARRTSPFSGVLDHACVSRVPTAPGLALVGDAALVSDYLWGTGCGFAFQSAELLVAETAAGLHDPGTLDAGLRRYRRRHRGAFLGHHLVTSDFASGRAYNPVERLVLSAAARDAATARHLQRFGERSIGPLRFFAPGPLARSARICLGAAVRG
jgi:2-polyprenyl-6-methoxyphenol hydroxylase-like FAD-dependent oxidoreductase